MDNPETVADVGEFPLIERLQRWTGAPGAVVGIGDDAAVLDHTGDAYLLATVDMLVEGVHFRLPPMPPHQLGARALAINVSDIAAMGGLPRHALVSLAVPPDLEMAAIADMYTGLHELASELGIGIVGGNVTRTAGPLCLDVTLLGWVPRSEVVLRSGARPGDLLAVTGTLGNAAAARRLELLGTDEGRTWKGFYEAQMVPTPRVQAGRALAGRHLPRAMMDVSDGLAGDIHHLARASGVGARIEERLLPVTDEVRQIALRTGASLRDLAIRGGEDYELLVALPPERLHEAQHLIAPVPLHPIGAITTPDEGVLIEGEDGTLEPLAPGGWTHF